MICQILLLATMIQLGPNARGNEPPSSKTLAMSLLLADRSEPDDAILSGYYQSGEKDLRVSDVVGIEDARHPSVIICV
jgi:hypothetical protein